MLEVCAQLPKTVPGTVITAIVAGVALVMVKLLNEKLQQHLPLPIPGELLTVRGPADRAEGQGRVDLASIQPPGIGGPAGLTAVRVLGCGEKLQQNALYWLLIGIKHTDGMSSSSNSNAYLSPYLQLPISQKKISSPQMVYLSACDTASISLP